MTQYHQPATLDEALALLAGPSGARVLAGATDILPAAVSAQGWGSPALRLTTQQWVDISRIDALGHIDVSARHLRIGAMVSWRQIADATLPRCALALQQAAREIGGAQIQNRGTIGGNLCNASPAADGVPPLLCLDATLTLASADSSRDLPLSAFLLGNRQTALAPGELLISINIALSDSAESRRSGFGTPADARSAFAKLGARRYLVISMVMGAITLKLDAAGLTSDIAVCIGACSPVARRLSRFEREAIGLHPARLPDLLSDRHFQELSPIDDVRASGSYRLLAARELVAELLTQAGTGSQAE